MLAPPDGLPEDVLVSVLASGWGIAAGEVGYRPLGFGSHHWEVVDRDGVRWFVTADDLETKRHSRAESLDESFARLRAALTAACELRERGHEFVVAPVRAADGRVLVRANDGFGLAVYPFVAGESFEWGEFSTPAHRWGVLEILTVIHGAPAAVREQAMADEFGIAHRDELEFVLDGGEVDDHGPYSRPMAELLAENAGVVRDLLARYDELVRTVDASRAVLTHGEPHPGNTMRTPHGWVLIDWETALVAPPERDLWGLDPGDGSVLDAYALATGVRPLPSMLELYRIRWDLSDVAIEVSHFRRRHTGSADDEQSWTILRRLVTYIGGRATAGWTSA